MRHIRLLGAKKLVWKAVLGYNLGITDAQGGEYSMRNKITAAIMLAAVLLLGGCSLTGNVLPPAHTDALPVVTVTLPGNDTAARP